MTGRTHLFGGCGYEDGVAVEDLKECRDKCVHELRILHALAVALDAIPDLDHKLLLRPEICALSAFHSSLIAIAAAAPCLLFSCALPLGPYQNLGPPAWRPWPQSCASPWRRCAQRAAAGSALQSTPTRFVRLCSSSCVVTGDSLQTMHWSRSFGRYATQCNAPGWLHLTAGKCRCIFMLVSNYKCLVAIGSLCSWKGKERPWWGCGRVPREGVV